MLLSPVIITSPLEVLLLSILPLLLLHSSFHYVREIMSRPHLKQFNDFLLNFE